MKENLGLATVIALVFLIIGSVIFGIGYTQGWRDSRSVCYGYIHQTQSMPGGWNGDDPCLGDR